MASISKQPNGRKTIQFVAHNGKRKSIRLGKVSLRMAESVKLLVEHLAAAAETGGPLDPETARKVAELNDDLRDKLAGVGLVERRARATVGDFTERYIDGRVDLKPLTIRHLKQARTNLVEYLGKDRPLSSVTPGDADGFVLHLIGKGFSANTTVRRQTGRAKQFFRAAVRKKLIRENPFDGQKTAVQANHEKYAFVSLADSQRVLDACPDAEWRLVFALARFGGLRCPSETLALRWIDVDWEHDRITVRSPKTEHHEGGESRVIPIFAELRPYLEAVFFDEAKSRTETEFVINRYRDTNANLRTQLLRIIRRAGLEPWVKPFQNLRSTRQTELAGRYPQHVVCKWMGNSQPVAVKHYLQTTDEHFTEAVQNPVHAALGGPTQASRKKPENPVFFGENEVCGVVHKYLVPPVGLEPTTR
ncbi:MAG: tyrosine-type recombinase/integrase [Thermoguttaceae bacterium]